MIAENPETYGDAIKKLVSHTLIVHYIWNHRIAKIPHNRDVWELLKLGELQKENDFCLKMSLTLLDGTNLEKQIAYRNSEGKNFTSTSSDIIFHIINHTTYHRGKLISLLKQKEVLPVETDYIYFSRKNRNL